MVSGEGGVSGGESLAGLIIIGLMIGLYARGVLALRVGEGVQLSRLPDASLGEERFELPSPSFSSSGWRLCVWEPRGLDMGLRVVCGLVEFVAWEVEEEEVALLLCE